MADRLHSAAIRLLRRAARQDTLSGQGPARLSALSVLVFAGPQTLGQLARSERVKPPTMSRLIAGLKRAGLASIEGDADDARRIRITATAQGRRVLEEARKRRLESIAESIQVLNGRELEILQHAAELIEQVLRP